jgi:nitroreductase
MKQMLVWIFITVFIGSTQAQELKSVKLLNPDKERGLPLMEALSIRASVREWSDEKLSLHDLSDLLWAADGINRPAEGKRTASSAMNAQDIDIYLFMDDGIYLYDAQQNFLNQIVTGDYRSLAGKTDAPVTLVLITDISRFRAGKDSLKIGWANMDAGIISQNISLFCAATGLKTRPRASFPGADKIRELLKLKGSQYILLNHPVGYVKK